MKNSAVQGGCYPPRPKEQQLQKRFCLLPPLQTHFFTSFHSCHFFHSTHVLNRYELLLLSYTFQFVSQCKGRQDSIFKRHQFCMHRVLFVYFIRDINRKFYDNCRNSRSQTHELIIYAMRQRARANNLTMCCRKNKLTTVFYTSVLLLIMNFVITLSNPL